MGASSSGGKSYYEHPKDWSDEDNNRYSALYGNLGGDKSLYDDIGNLMDEKNPARQKDAINGLIYSLSGRKDAEQLVSLLRRLQKLK